MIFPSRNQLASKQIRGTGRAEAVTKEGLAATLLPGRQPDQMGQRHSLRPVGPRSCPGPLRNGSLCCISTRMWALPLYEGKGVDGPGCRVASGRVAGPKGNLSVIPAVLSRSRGGAVTRRAVAQRRSPRQRLDSPLGGGYPGFWVGFCCRSVSPVPPRYVVSRLFSVFYL